MAHPEGVTEFAGGGLPQIGIAQAYVNLRKINEKYCYEILLSEVLTLYRCKVDRNRFLGNIFV